MNSGQSALEVPVKERVEQLRREQHFRIVQSIQQNDRFHVYLIEQEGERRILKIAVTPDLASNLERDIRMSMFLMTMARANATTTYRIRTICSFGRGWFIGQFFDADPLLRHQKHEPEKKVMHVAQNIWAPFLAEVSSYTPYLLQQRPFYISAQGMYTKDYYDRHAELVRWAETARKQGLITDSEIRRIMDYIEGNARVISTGIEMIDVKPWDAFLLDDDVVGLVDLEYTTLLGRQYFDVAWSYLRFWADSRSEPAARAFLRSYMDHSVYDLRSFAPPFLTTLGMKLLGYLNDLAEYMEKAETASDPKERQLPFSKKELRDMLDAYLQFNVTALV